MQDHQQLQHKFSVTTFSYLSLLTDSGVLYIFSHCKTFKTHPPICVLVPPKLNVPTPAWVLPVCEKLHTRAIFSDEQSIGHKSIWSGILPNFARVWLTFIYFTQPVCTRHFYWAYSVVLRVIPFTVLSHSGQHFTLRWRNNHSASHFQLGPYFEATAY